ncbi:MAG: hypothetical protein K9N35_07960 [Candidatus Marinimicrobia bacterium]|nr:hypothetical protein [Candidatus Neomarinimicrobiota bacterium]
MSRGFLLIAMVAQVFAAKAPRELTSVINHFLNLEATSLEIHQVIDWRFFNKHDSLSFRMDIKAGRNFHMNLAAFGMEIFVTESEMMTLNHVRAQILYEDASPDALLKQLFVGGDLNDARFKGQKQLGNGLRQLDFVFVGDFSDWESLSVILDDEDDLKKLTLVDYDGNNYLITLHYLEQFEDFNLPDLKTEYVNYQVADLRK